MNINNFGPVHVQNENNLLHHIFYNTTIKTYANGEQKIKYHSYDTCIGFPSLKKEGRVSTESKEHSRYISLLRSKQKIIDLVYHNGLIKPWKYFLTLTFDPDKVNSNNYEAVSEALKKWTNNMKHQNPDMEYVIVPEPHKSGRIHFHGLFRGVTNWKLTEARNPKTNRKIIKNGVQVFNLDNYKYGYSTVSVVKDLTAVSVYISKYMTKELLNLSYKKRYWASKTLELPVTEYAMFDEQSFKFYIDSKSVVSEHKIDSASKTSIFIKTAPPNNLEVDITYIIGSSFSFML